MKDQDICYVLPDILGFGLKLVFCGTAASTISAKRAAYYANPTNYFWRTLYQTGLTPYHFEPQHFAKLLDHGMGLTDLVKTASGNDSDLNKQDYDVADFEKKMHIYQPEMIAFTSKTAASMALGIRTANLQYGQQTNRLGYSEIWVLPSPSGAARRYWDVSYWKMLAQNMR